MKQTNMNDYRSLMGGVELPEQIRENVMRAVEQTDEGQRTEAAKTSPHARTAKRSHPLVRGVAVAACAVVLAVGLAFAGNAVPWPSALPADSTIKASLPTSGNFFTLAAYAAEQGEGKLEQSATLEFKNFGIGGGWSWGSYDVETGLSHEDGDSPNSVGDDGTCYAQVGYFLDLTCVGNNIRSVTYSIDGEGVHFTSENRTYGPNDRRPVDFKEQDSFTIAYGEQAADKAKIQRKLVAYFPLEGRAIEIWAVLKKDYEKQKEVHDSLAPDGGSAHISRSEHPELLSDIELKTLNDELGQIILRRYGEILSESPLTLTVTYDDGSTETKSYLIAPVEDFEQRYADFCAESYKNPRALWPTLYTITEIES